MFSWPAFDTKQALDGAAAVPGVIPLRGWTATFESYDQYRDNCYYRVTLLDGDRSVGEFMVVVGIEFAGNDWTGPDFEVELRSRIARVAATGATNTEYRGYPK